MIRKVRSKLSVKVFLLTLLLVAACCGATYHCIVRFAPYIYSHELSDAWEIGDMLCADLSYTYPEDAQYVLQEYNGILKEEFDGEFIFRIFKSSGRSLPRLISTGLREKQSRTIKAPDRQWNTWYFSWTAERITVCC